MRIVLRVVAIVIVLLLAAVALAGWMLRRSLAPDDERLALAGLDGAVTIATDSLGIPTITATTSHDVAFAQGYAHARDRRFQMELLRRNAAGRLAEVFGPLALEADREKRALGFGAVAESALAVVAPERRALWTAYAAGVNAWDAHHPAPPEFLALGIPREPWRPQDFVLVIASMFYDLQFDGDNERMVETMDRALPAGLVAFLTPDRTPGDVLLAGDSAYAPPPIPPATEFDARAKGASAAALLAPRAASLVAAIEEPARGSNNWAIAPMRTRAGRAILCGDPHLGLSVPTIWHRQRLEAPGLAISGATLPGTIGVVIGANPHVAWSLTNVEGDFIDRVRVKPVAGDSSRYQGPAGPEPFRMRREIIRVHGRKPDTLDVRETRWGPVFRDVRDEWLALEWGALKPAAYDFDFETANRASDVASLFAAIDGYRGPAQNFVAADDQGHIGWRIGGRLPRRGGFDARRPRDGASGAGWTGEVPQDSMPRVIDPPAGFVTTANQRTVGGEGWRAIGNAAGMPWRARRIHDQLASRSDWDARSAAALQNDLDDALLHDTAVALDRALTPEAIGHDSTLAAARRLVDRWEHRADTTSASHAFLRQARVALHQLLLEPLVAPCLAGDSSFVYFWNLEDEVVRRLLDERPMNLLAPRFVSYDALALAAADSAAVRLERRYPGRPLERITWGMVNRSRIRHPLGAAVPALGRWLNMPDVALAGGSSVVRVARSGVGASLRIVVDFGGERIFSLPGGESGHFLSKHYGDEYADWVAGRYGPLDPGTAKHRIELTPGKN